MKTQKYLQYILIGLIATILTSCGVINHDRVTRVSKGSSVYVWKDKKGKVKDSLSIKKTTTAIAATIIENDGYLVITPLENAETAFPDSTKILGQTVPPGFRTDIQGEFYYPETKFDPAHKKAHFRYTDFSHGLQAMSVLLKFRGNVPAGTVSRIPPQVETGTSFGLAYAFKHSWNSYSPDKNFWGKHTSSFTISGGPMIGGSAVELKAATNAPDLNGDRKSAVISYGGFLMVGTGPINIGYAIGADRVLGYGASNWVYGGKIWHGVIVGINLITF